MLRTPEEYKASLKAMRPNIYKFGELIKDVTTHPATRRTVEGHARIFKAQHESEHKEIVTTISSLTREPISRYLSIIRTPEDMYANSRMKRLIYNLTGTCTGGRCAGWTAINSLWATSYEIDQAMGTTYHQRLKNWLVSAQQHDITVAGALTDPKGDRTRAPHQQDDPDMHLHMIEEQEGGIVVRGAKIQICGVAAANEIFVLPGSSYKKEDSKWCVSFAIPRDIEGLTIVETRHPSDMRDFEEGEDNPVKRGGITQAYLLFEDVFVPEERIFMAGEAAFTRSSIMNFILPYRSAIGACVAGQGDMMIGAAALLARANGLSEKVFRQKMVQMSINNETTFGMGIAAAAMGKQHPSGTWFCDTLLSNVNKVHVATLPYDTKALTQDIGGGIAETGCMPSWIDLQSEEYGALLKKYLKAGDASPETRIKLARFIEWLTLGAGVPGCMHGGGSPDGAKMFIGGTMGTKKFVELVKDLLEIDEEI